MSRTAGLPINFCRKEGAGRNAGKNSASPPRSATKWGEHAPAAVERSPALRSTILFLQCRSRWKAEADGECGGRQRQNERRFAQCDSTCRCLPPHDKCRSFLQCAPTGRTKQYSSLYSDRRHTIELHRGTLGGTLFGGSQMCSFTILPRSILSSLTPPAFL